MGIEKGPSLNFVPDDDAQENSEALEEITLKFPEVYKSPEWKSLDPIDRAQLLLVTEGARPGAIIGGDFTSFQKIVEKMDLATHLNSEDWELGPVYEVARPEILSQRYRELVSLSEKTPAEEFHRFNGRFLGYPSCCTEEYINPTKNRGKIIKQYGAKGQEKIPNVTYEVSQLIEQGQQYPKELDYCPPTYTPCSATCPNALATLRKWKQLLEYADPEAAEQLKQFNWQSEPYRSVHQEEMDKRDMTEIETDKIQFLRKSAGLEE